MIILHRRQDLHLKWNNRSARSLYSVYYLLPSVIHHNIQCGQISKYIYSWPVYVCFLFTTKIPETAFDLLPCFHVLCPSHWTVLGFSCRLIFGFHYLFCQFSNAIPVLAPLFQCSYLPQTKTQDFFRLSRLIRFCQMLTIFDCSAVSLWAAISCCFVHYENGAIEIYIRLNCNV